jgi:hypothetical protein
MSYITVAILALIYNGFVIGAVLYNLEKDSDELIDWCSGSGFLVVLTSGLYFGLFYKYVVKKFLAKWIAKQIFDPQRYFFPKNHIFSIESIYKFEFWLMYCLCSLYLLLNQRA